MRMEQADLFILQEVRLCAVELHKLAAEANYQVVHGEEVQGEILVAVLACKVTLSKIGKCPTGQAHHCRWKMGGQQMSIRSGYFQGGTQQHRDASDQVLAEWLEAAEVSGEPTLIAGDFNGTQAELPVSMWFAAAGWQELGGLEQPATCLPSRGQPRRIDWLLASRGLLPAIRGPAEVRWDIGVKPHAVQLVKVDLTERGMLPPRLLRWRAGGRQQRRTGRWHRSRASSRMTRARRPGRKGQPRSRRSSRRSCTRHPMPTGVRWPGEPDCRSSSRRCAANRWKRLSTMPPVPATKKHGGRATPATSRRCSRSRPASPLTGRRGS